MQTLKIFVSNFIWQNLTSQPEGGVLLAYSDSKAGLKVLLLKFLWFPRHGAYDF